MSKGVLEEFNYVLSNILCYSSILFSFFFILILKKKESNYARIVRHIVMAEGIAIFCFLGAILRGQESKILKIVKSFSKELFHILTFNLFFYDNPSNFYKLMDILNLAMYYSMEAFSLTFSIFICLELILILRNPIAQMKSRFKPYFIFCFFLAISLFIMICTIDELPSIKDDEDYNIRIEEYLFMDAFQM